MTKSPLRLVAAFSIFVVITGCGGGTDFESASNNNSQTNNESDDSKSNDDVATERHDAASADDKKSAADFSTPKKTVETFFIAASKSDSEILSQCFADTAESEFKRIKDKEVPAEGLQELAALVEGAEIGDSIVQENNDALVRVKFKGRDEEISLVDTDDGWKIVGF